MVRIHQDIKYLLSIVQSHEYDFLECWSENRLENTIFKNTPLIVEALLQSNRHFSDLKLLDFIPLKNCYF